MIVRTVHYWSLGQSAYWHRGTPRGGGRPVLFLGWKICMYTFKKYAEWVGGRVQRNFNSCRRKALRKVKTRSVVGDKQCPAPIPRSSLPISITLCSLFSFKLSWCFLVIILFIFHFYQYFHSFLMIISLLLEYCFVTRQGVH